MREGLCHACHIESKRTSDSKHSGAKKRTNSFYDDVCDTGVILCRKCGSRVKYERKENGITTIYVSK